ncbi:MAG: hypothetical protein RIS29_3 [Bacteroidota bacterium]|jgi:Ca-activated chloride channel family protein
MKTTLLKRMLMLAGVSLAVAQMAAQSFIVRGKVTDQSGAALVGVMVREKESNTSTLTDSAGRFQIQSALKRTLTFRYIGYELKERKVTGPLCDVQLKDSHQTLNEVMVIGGNPTYRSTAGATSVVLSSIVPGIAVQKKMNYNSSPSPNVGYVSFAPSANTEEYGKWKENRFMTAQSDPLSTFSLDVDVASYSNIRRMINNGQQPEKDAVRIEEMLNYFSYNYPQAIGKDPVRIITELAVCPWNATHQLVRIGVKAREIATENLPASNFIFLLDVSGSMNAANKLELVKSSIKLLTNNLRPQDHVAIVVYAGAAGVVLPSTMGSDKQKILEAVQNLQAGGSTAGGAGIELAYKTAEKNFIKGGNNRVILCTDGDFNVGVSNNDELESLIESKRKTGIYLTALGYGMGNYKDNKLQTLAEKGNGNHAYIDNLQEANKVLVQEFGSTMYTVAKDVKIQLEFNPTYVNAYRLIGYESRLLKKEDFNDDTKDAGELGSGHTVTALYEIIPVGVANSYGGVDDLKYQKTTQPTQTNTGSNELLTVKLRYKAPDKDSSEKIEVPVLASSIHKTASEDFRFAMAVTMFGQLLRDSDFKGESSYDKALTLARSSLGGDEHGYRREFVRLVETMEQLSSAQ